MCASLHQDQLTSLLLKSLILLLNFPLVNVYLLLTYSTWVPEHWREENIFDKQGVMTLFVWPKVKCSISCSGAANIVNLLVDYWPWKSNIKRHQNVKAPLQCKRTELSFIRISDQALTRKLQTCSCFPNRTCSFLVRPNESGSLSWRPKLMVVEASKVNF